MIAFDERALEDLDEAFALRQIKLIKSGVLILNEHPRIGRRVARSQLRQLVISTTRRTGFIVLYEYDEFERLVRIVAIRHQRERGYSR